MKYIFIVIIKLYQLTFSKILPPSCRFTPNCSEYAANAFRSFGTVKGGYLTIRRLFRCNPYSEGGYDPIPLYFTWRYNKNNSNK